MSKLGHLDQIDAFEFAHHLCLQGSGANPSLGWINWFSAIEAMPNTYEFRQEPPAGTVLPVAMPFQINGAFASNGVKEVVVRHLVKGKPTDVRVAVRPISRLEEEAITSLVPSSVRAYLRYKAADRTLPRDGASFSMRLGSVDIPFAGSAWNDPPRALRHVLHLGVDALWSSVAEIERAILDAFKRGLVAAHLETVLTPTGWPYGPQPFHDAIEARLQATLRERLVSVRVTTTSHCLEVEPPPAPVHYLRSISPPIQAPA